MTRASTPPLSPRPTSRHGRCLPALLLAAGLGACSPQVQTHGDKVEADRVARISPGAQSKDDVIRLLGSPSSTAVFDDETWYYISSVVENNSIFDREVTERQVLVVRFDNGGVVRAVEEFGLERGRKVNIVDRETPSFGESQSFLQQILGNIGRFNTGDQQPRR